MKLYLIQATATEKDDGSRYGYGMSIVVLANNARQARELAEIWDERFISKDKSSIKSVRLDKKQVVVAFYE